MGDKGQERREGSAYDPRDRSGVPEAAAASECERESSSAAARASDSLEPLRDVIAPSDPAGGEDPGAVNKSGDPRALSHEGREMESPESAPASAAAGAEVKAILEALIFASPEPLTRKAINTLLASEPKEDVDAAIAQLKRDYDQPGGLQLVEVAGGYQIVTREELHEWVRRLFHERTTQKLTLQALETLAVIAYRQPITAAEITEIRGVNTSGVLNTLLERHLIKIVGRKRVVGRPFLYATTKEFLIRFGLNDLSDLPKVEDMAEALGFEPPALLVEQTPGEELLPADEPEEPEADDDGSAGSVH